MFPRKGMEWTPSSQDEQTPTEAICQKTLTHQTCSSLRVHERVGYVDLGRHSFISAAVCIFISPSVILLLTGQSSRISFVSRATPACSKHLIRPFPEAETSSMPQRRVPWMRYATSYGRRRSAWPRQMAKARQFAEECNMSPASWRTCGGILGRLVGRWAFSWRIVGLKLQGFKAP